MKKEEQEAKKEIESFEYMRDMAELKAFSNLSLERPLTDEEYKKMISLGKKLNLVNWTT
ncbi:hypothetical protein LCGC14_2218080 [marine sediment metagenome]|uniref:Uncharacterized protein n=1 Tax=marine sediment metagenome TaxID=412755 RepID=A0A0F9DBS3_9ZZZZ